MTKGPTGQSLGRRLSLWLALQGLAGALIVSSIVYAISGWTFRLRQQELLELKSHVVRGELANSSTTADAQSLRHRLEGFLAGHEAMSLSVRTSSGALLFGTSASATSDAGPRSYRSMVWGDRWPAGSGDGVTVEMGIDLGEDDALLTRIGVIVFAASLIGAMLTSLTGYGLVRRGLRPIRALTEQLDAVSPQRLDARLQGAGQPLELRPLIEHFNALLSRVEAAHRRLEGFNADVAHELRTPLTALIGTSELALRSLRSRVELQEVIADNLEDLRRLSAIVDDMLFLSRADRGDAARRSHTASLRADLTEIAEYHAADLEERGLTMAVEGDASGDFDVSLLRRVLSNLLSNASRHAEAGTVVRVRVEARAGRVRLSVSNRGPAIDRSEHRRLFDRFYRADPSRDRASSQHHGLGLAIVAAIAGMHGGEAFALSADGINTFGVDLPDGTSAEGRRPEGEPRGALTAGGPGTV